MIDNNRNRSRFGSHFRAAISAYREHLHPRHQLTRAARAPTRSCSGRTVQRKILQPGGFRRPDPILAPEPGRRCRSSRSGS